MDVCSLSVVGFPHPITQFVDARQRSILLERLPDHDQTEITRIRPTSSQSNRPRVTAADGPNATNTWLLRGKQRRRARSCRVWRHVQSEIPIKWLCTASRSQSCRCYLYCLSHPRNLDHPWAQRLCCLLYLQKGAKPEKVVGQTPRSLCCQCPPAIPLPYVPWDHNLCCFKCKLSWSLRFAGACIKLALVSINGNDLGNRCSICCLILPVSKQRSLHQRILQARDLAPVLLGTKTSEKAVF